MKVQKEIEKNTQHNVTWKYKGKNCWIKLERKTGDLSDVTFFGSVTTLTPEFFAEMRQFLDAVEKEALDGA